MGRGTPCFLQMKNHCNQTGQALRPHGGYCSGYCSKSSPPFFTS